MDINEIKTLIEIVDKSSFGVLAFKKGDLELVLKKSNIEEKNVLLKENASPKEQVVSKGNVSLKGNFPKEKVVPKTVMQKEAVMPKETIPEVDILGKDSNDSTNQQQEKAPKSIKKVLAPLVGIFYQASSPEAEPFVTVGQMVQKGDTVCIIEAMKILNEIKAPASGKVMKIYVNNGDVVEFNQTIMEIGE